MRKSARHLAKKRERAPEAKLTIPSRGKRVDTLEFTGEKKKLTCLEEAVVATLLEIKTNCNKPSLEINTKAAAVCQSAFQRLEMVAFAWAYAQSFGHHPPLSCGRFSPPRRSGARH